LQHVKKLLELYCLSFPATFPIRSDADSSPHWLDAHSDPGTAVLISLPPRGKGRAAVNSCGEVKTECGGDMEPDEQTVHNISLHQPTDVTKRFQALIRDFLLEPVEVSDGPLFQRSTSRTADEKEKATSTRHFERIKLSDVKPRWKLCTTCETVW
jgi:hypothetical protein